MLKMGEWITKVKFVLAKWSYGLFVLSLLINMVLTHQFMKC